MESRIHASQEYTRGQLSTKGPNEGSVNEQMLRVNLALAKSSQEYSGAHKNRWDVSTRCERLTPKSPTVQVGEITHTNDMAVSVLLVTKKQFFECFPDIVLIILH